MSAREVGSGRRPAVNQAEKWGVFLRHGSPREYRRGCREPRRGTARTRPGCVPGPTGVGPSAGHNTFRVCGRRRTQTFVTVGGCADRRLPEVADFRLPTAIGNDDIDIGGATTRCAGPRHRTCRSRPRSRTHDRRPGTTMRWHDAVSAQASMPPQRFLRVDHGPGCRDQMIVGPPHPVTRGGGPPRWVRPVRRRCSGPGRRAGPGGPCGRGAI